MPEDEGPVVIVGYDPSWPKMFDEEKARVLKVAGRRIAAIEHIGSTAVVGLGAKPIIDMMAGVRVLSDADRCVSSFASISYRYHPEKEEAFPERR